MAFYKTGRSRVLTLTGTWTSVIHVKYECTRTYPELPNGYVVMEERWPHTFEMAALGVRATFTNSNSFNSFPAPGDCGLVYSGVDYPVTKSLTVFEGTAYETTVSQTETGHFDVGDLVSSDIDPSGVVTVTCEVEEWFEVVSPLPESDTHGFPNYGGAAQAHGLTSRGVRFFEKLKPETTFSASFDGMAAVAWSGAVTTAISDAVGEIGYSVYRSGEVYAKNMVGLMSCPVDFGGEAVTAPYSVELGGSSFDATTGFELADDRSASEIGYASGGVSATPLLEIDFGAALFSGSGAYPDSLVLEVQARAGEASRFLTLNPAGGDTWTQSAWSASATLRETAVSPGGSDTFRAVRGWLTSASLSSAGDDTRDWRMLIRGRAWSALSLGHLAETVLDDGSSAGPWTAGGGAVVSSVDGVLTVVVSGGVGSLSRSLIPAVASEGYRFLKVRVRSLSENGQPIVVAIGGKSWTVMTGGAGVWVDRWIDLCRPDGISDVLDTKDSRHPLLADGSVDDSVYWGVSVLDGLTVSGLADGEIYEFDSFTLARKSRARGSFLSSFLGWRSWQAGSGDQVNQGFWSEVDGRVSDGYDLELSGGSYSWPNLAELSSSFAGFGGWTSNVLADIGDGYHGSGLEGLLAFGSGALWDGADWQIGVEVDLSSSVDVLAQALWDEVSLYPGCGEVFDAGGDYGVPTKLRAATHLRGMAWGLLFGGGSVELREEGGADRGSGTADALVSYRTGSPYGRGHVNHEAVVASSWASSGLFEVHNRAFHRRCFVEATSIGRVSMDWNLSGMHVRATLDSSGTVRVGTKDNALMSGFLDFDAGFTADGVSVRWDLGRERLWLLTTEEGVVKERFSDDLGETWSMATTLATGSLKWPALAVHPDGRRFAYWLNGDQVDGVLRDRSGAVLATVSGLRSGVDEGGLATCTFDQPGGLVVVEMLTVESGAVVVTTSTDGESFT